MASRYKFLTRRDKNVPPIPHMDRRGFLTPPLSNFQIAVYDVVRKIPKGQVRSYKWVAQQIHKPKAVRAVGRALKKNPFIGIVPCHRVIASDGSVGGFSKGIKKKLQMLKAEGVIIHS